jgi:hypothetical protein
MDRCTPAAEVERALVHFLPEPADLQRVLADEECRKPAADLVGGRRLDNRLGDGR